MESTDHPAAVQEWEDWTWQLDHAIRTPATLRAALGLSAGQADAVARVQARYPLLITPYYLGLARSSDPADPILRQCVPDLRELDAASGVPDPLAEGRDSPVPGLVHRYRDRVLVITSNRCAVHCRHCMRKRNWGRPEGLTAADIEAMVRYVSADPAIREVILSGGDPLLLADSALGCLLDRFLAIPHIEMIRLGSRVPAVLPQRVTPGLCRVLATRGPLWLATHFNHPLELSPRAAQAARDLARAGVFMVNQTVLLKGVNDDAGCLRALFTGLLKMGIKPYYLFHGDPIRGAMHFRTGIRRGLELMRALRAQTSGLAIPAFAIDLPGGQGKIRLEPEADAGIDAQGIPCYRDARGQRLSYPDSGPWHAGSPRD